MFGGIYILHQILTLRFNVEGHFNLERIMFPTFVCIFTYVCTIGSARTEMKTCGSGSSCQVAATSRESWRLVKPLFLFFFLETILFHTKMSSSFSFLPHKRATLLLISCRLWIYKSKSFYPPLPNCYCGPLANECGKQLITRVKRSKEKPTIQMCSLFSDHHWCLTEWTELVRIQERKLSTF